MLLFGLLLVCGGTLPADFVADVLEGPSLPGHPSLFLFHGEMQFRLKLCHVLPLLEELLLQSLTLFLRKQLTITLTGMFQTARRIIGRSPLPALPGFPAAAAECG